MSEEAARAVLQNIYTFIRIADKAASAAVASWDAQSLHNALQWAAYCQQLATKVNGRSLEPVLEDRLQEMSQLLDRPGAQHITLKFLNKAVDALVERLVFNPHLSDSLLQDLRQTVETKYAAHVSTLQQNLASAKCDLHFRTAVASQIKELGSLLKSNSIGNQAYLPQRDPTVQNCVRLLLEQLTLWLEKEQNSDRFERQLKDVAECLNGFPHGWSVLVMCLAVDMSKVEIERRQGLRRVQQFLVIWMACHHGTSGSACPLWKVETMLLVQAAEHHVQFCDWYLRALEQLTQSLEPDYSVSASHTAPDTFHTHLYTWRNPKTIDKTPAFDSVLLHFSHLLSADSVVKNKALAVLTARTTGSVFSIWTDLTKNLVAEFT